MDMKNGIRLTRQELYDKVWSAPMSWIAEEYGLSDVGLAKICSRHQIPRPGPGYWARKAHGKPVERTPLPVPMPGNDEAIEIAVEELKERRPAFEVFEDTKAEFARVSKLAPPAVVDNVRLLKHPLVLKMKEIIRGYHRGYEGCVSTGKRTHPNVNVTTWTWERALRILDAVFRCAEERGYTVHVEEGEGTLVRVLGEDVQISLREKSKRIDAPPKPAGSNRFWPIDKKYDFVHTGILGLSITNVYDRKGGRVNWTDREDSKLEDQLGEFLEGLVNAAARLKAHRLEREEWNRERHEQEKIWAQQRIREEQERERVQGLLEAADSWARSRKIRDYIEARRAAEVKRNGEISPSSDFAKWLVWATHVADKLDSSTAETKST